MIKVSLPAKVHPQKNHLARLPAGGDALFIASLASAKKLPFLYIARDGYELRRLADEINFFQPGMTVGVFPDYEVLPYERQSPYAELVAERLKILWQLQQQKLDIILIQASTLQTLLPPLEYFNQRVLWLKKTNRIDGAILREKLVAAGYQHVKQVFAEGEFAIRGSIIDIMPIGLKRGIRIDLFDDEIETLASFDTKTQLLEEQIDEIKLLPSREYPNDYASLKDVVARFSSRFPNEAKSSLAKDLQSSILPAGVEFYLPLFFVKCASFFDYLSQNCQIIYNEELLAVLNHNWQEINKRYEYYSYQYPCLKPTELFIPAEEVFARLKQHTCWEIAGTDNLYAGFDHVGGLLQGRGQFDWLKELKTKQVIICSPSLGRLEILKNTLASQGISSQQIDSLADISSNKISLVKSELNQGFIYENSVFLTESDLYPGSVVSRNRKYRKSGQSAKNDLILRDLAEIQVGDYVVHLNHGIGRYVGLSTQTIADTNYDMLELEYQGGSKLFIPVTNLHLISRYSHLEGTNVELTKLGSKGWDKIKAKTEQKVNDVAAELLELYARREMQEGHAYTLPEEYPEFAASFGYEPTPDQQNSFDEIIRDLTAIKPMDRLVCGDVGFGKTEVAMRAAFIVAMSGYQVAILAPTTLLTEQLYQKFVNRFAGLPVTVGEVSRFRSKKEINETLHLLAEGRLDIIVGTHRLIQEDVKFAKLGLVIIDEEHRFGVKQKERLKQLRTNVDILTMTATPIPRTLSMALDGLRDFSVIATAPSRRLSVNTITTTDDDSVIQEAILREVRRGGQVFFLYNDVASIERMFERLINLMPELRIAIAHGQMPEAQLEQTIKDFINQRFNLLLCSTIIETGIDIPNANTILIYRADKFGLAQLHQLRGRVGRSYHQAYCYLIIPEKITPDAEKRLDAISMTSELGAGFNLALHDLEIRGAGEVLGDNQAGNIKEVGLSLYTEMLKKAIRKLKQGEKIHGSFEVESSCDVNLNVTAILPEDYCLSVHERLIYYKRLARAEDQEQIDQVYQEIIDSYGLPPEPVKNLIASHSIRIIAVGLGINKLDATSSNIVLQFIDNPPLDPLKIVLVMQELKTCKYDGKSKLIWQIKSDSVIDKIKNVNSIIGKLAN